MRLHFQGNPQAETQRRLPYRGKTPKRKNSRIPEFQDTPSTDSFTYSRSHSLVSVPSHQHLSHYREFTSNQKGTDNCKWLLMNLQDEGNNLTAAPWGQLRSHWFLWGGTRPLYLLMPKEKPEQTHPKNWPHRTKGLVPQIFDIFSGKVTMWEDRKLGFTAQEILPISSHSQEVFYLFNLQRRYRCGMSAASWQWQTELRPDYSTLGGTDTQFQWCYFDPAWHEPIIRIQKF